MNLMTVAVCLLAGSFQVLQYPLPSPNARAFAARVEPTGSAEIFVLDGHTLTIYPDAQPDSPAIISLRPGTTAIDIADINGDGRSELLSIVGETVLRHALPAPAAPQGSELFQLRTHYADMESPPHLQVLVVPHATGALLALPVKNALELRSASGDLIESVPLEEAHATYSGYGQAFGTRVQQPPQLTSPGGLEIRVSYYSTLVPSDHEDRAAGIPDPTMRRRGTSRQLLEAGRMTPENWPWFPLRTGQPAQERVLFAASDARFRELMVRIRRERISAETGATGYEAGPPRRYPGILVTQDLEQPDFNGDGFADLFLWSAAEPTITANALAKAAVNGSWPLLLMVHLYAPDKNRFEPRTAAHLRLDVPLSWYLSAPAEAPLRNIVLADFNGDTRIDFGCSRSKDEFSVWLFSDKGFSTTPDFTHTFSETLQKIEFTVDLSNRNRTSIGLRGESALFLLRPAPDITTFSLPIQSAGSAAGAGREMR